MSQTKKCSKCKIELGLNCFFKKKSAKSGLNSSCKKCVKQYDQSYRKDNAEIIAAKKLEYRKANADVIAAKKSAYYRLNSEAINTKCRDYNNDNFEKVTQKKREYYKLNTESICLKNREYDIRNREQTANRKRIYANKMRKTDVIFSMKHRIRNLIRMSLVKRNYTKKSRTHEILGCDFETFANHLKSQFKDGMSWDNRSEWHIDHKIPLASAKTEEDVLRLNHYTNLQPLWAIDNLKKGKKIAKTTL
jgi:predicted ribonuclease YlaK